jgi:hypothetical protein
MMLTSQRKSVPSKGVKLLRPQLWFFFFALSNIRCKRIEVAAIQELRDERVLICIVGSLLMGERYSGNRVLFESMLEIERLVENRHAM